MSESPVTPQTFFLNEHHTSVVLKRKSRVKPKCYTYAPNEIYKILQWAGDDNVKQAVENAISNEFRKEPDILNRLFTAMVKGTEKGRRQSEKLFGTMRPRRSREVR